MSEPLFETTPVLQVGQFNQLINSQLAELGEFIVEGEISQLQVSQGKWLFLTIKDDQASVSVFASVFRITTASLLSEGMKVQVYGKAGLYEKTARFSLNAYRIVPSGEGALRLAYERLKAKLAQEGLFDSQRKRPLPYLPARIGLITAKGARAYSDFIKVIGERLGGMTIEFYPVQVQGSGSVESILQVFAQIQAMSNPPEVIVLTRGGGSLEDLLSFNDERVARAVFGCKVPVVSAIGHEEDVALTDFVADLRASTPSNAAELLVPSRQELKIRLQSLETHLNQAVEQLFENAQVLVTGYAQSLSNCLLPSLHRIEVLQRKLQQQYGQVLGKLQTQQKMKSYLTNRLCTAVSTSLRSRQTALLNLERLLRSLDYRAVLRRGYSITFDAQGHVVSEVSALEAGATLKTQLSAGTIMSTITAIKPPTIIVTEERIT